MKHGHRLAAALAAFLAAADLSPALAQGAGPAEESAETLPAGPGRDETFGLCSACHAYRIVANQGLTRERWDETLTWMTERHGMPPLEGAERELILAYLAKAHPPKAGGRGGFRSPF